jgi:plasmid stabilization system protein ParE
LIRYTAKARSQIRSLTAHYERIERDEAVSNLSAALTNAEERIARAPHEGLPAPRPYPMLRSADRLWIKEGRYWIAYRPSPEPMIVGVFYESANIPGRL